MEDFLGALVQRIENSGSSFSQEGYAVVGAQVMPLLQVMLVAYVAFYGLQLVTGTARIAVAEVVGRLARMMVILALVQAWPAFDVLIYQWINETPEDVDAPSSPPPERELPNPPMVCRRSGIPPTVPPRPLPNSPAISPSFRA